MGCAADKLIPRSDAYSDNLKDILRQLLSNFCKYA